MSENYYLISDNDVHMPIRCTMQRFDHIRQQMHDYFELSMIVSGSCTLQFDDHMYSLREDDIFCINPLTLHELHGVNCVIITVLFNQTLFEQILPVPSHPRFFCISPMSDNQEAIAQLRSLIAHIIKTNVDKKDGYELRNWSYIYNVMDIMYLHFRVKLSTANEKKNHKYAIRIAEILEVDVRNFLSPGIATMDELMETLFWMDEENRGLFHLFLLNDSESETVGITMRDKKTMSYLQEWMGKKQKLGDGRITEEEYLEWKLHWPENKRKTEYKTV